MIYSLLLVIAAQFIWSNGVSCQPLDKMALNLQEYLLYKSNIQSNEVSKIVLALAYYYNNENTTDDTIMLRFQTLSFKLQLHLLADLLQKQDSCNVGCDGRKHNMTTVDNAVHLAEYILASHSVCLDPHRFFSRNLVDELKKKLFFMNSTLLFSRAYVLAALCVSGHSLSPNHYKLLFNVDFDLKTKFVADTISMFVLALQCMYRSAQRVRDRTGIGSQLSRYVEILSNLQKPDGSFGTVMGTLFSMQALSSSTRASVGWDPSLSHRYVLSLLSPDADWLNNSVLTSYSLLALTHSSLIGPGELRACNTQQLSKSASKWSEFNFNRPSIEARSNRYQLTVVLKNTTLWVWINNSVGVEYSISLMVPADYTVYNTLLMAAENDERFEFATTTWPNGYYLYKIGGFTEHKVGYWFWLMYQLPSPPDKYNKPTTDFVASQGIAKLVPENNQHILFWYKKI